MLPRCASSSDIIDAEVVEAGSGSAALVKVEKEIEAEIVLAQKTEDTSRLRNLGRLLVLLQSAEGIAKEVASVTPDAAKEASDAVRQAAAQSLSKFVGKDDYDMADVAEEMGNRFEKLGAASANRVAGLVERVRGEFAGSAQAAITSFTGKETYEVGDVSKEVARRAREAVMSFTGKEEYKFGDITKTAVKQLTGKDEYQFGDRKSVV